MNRVPFMVLPASMFSIANKMFRVVRKNHASSQNGVVIFIESFAVVQRLLIFFLNIFCVKFGEIEIQRTFTKYQ